jgi:iron complex outermembrane receptor protein
MFKTSKLTQAICLGFGGSVLISSAAFAQQAPAASGPVQQLEKVEITGSRIKRVDAESSQPIFTLRREDMQAQGLTSVGDVIQNITSNGSALNSTFNNGGNGETRVSLRNLGSNRTLVLVNGRRWVGGTGLGGSVDLNTLPTAAVDRIEVLKDGASVTYGSDAVAGVINVILRKNYEGAEINVYSGAYDKKDGDRNSVDFTIGSSGERFRGMLGVGYVKEAPVMAGNRDISAEPIFGTGTSFGSSTGPAGRFAVCNGTWNPSNGSCSGTQTRPDGSAGQFTYDAGKGGTGWRNWAAPGDIYNFAPDNYLVTPQERTSVFAKASFDVTSSISANLTAVFNNRRSEQLLAAMPIVLGSGPGAGTQARLLSISQNSIYNPFGKDVSRIQRRAVETGGRSFNQDVTTYVVSSGVEGSFELGDNSFNWDVGATYGRNAQSDRTVGLFNVAALRNALGPSMRDASGKPVCVSQAGNLGTTIPGCVPLNLLGAPGTITKDMLAYSSFVAQDTLGSKMTHTFANLSGDVFELPAGMVTFGAGVERRTDSGFDQPDALIASGQTTGNARTPTSGAYSVREGYLELLVPVLKKVPAFQKLELSLATRTSRYSNFGDTNNSKVGLKWKVIDSLALRANWGQGFRAPSISELFQGVSDAFPQIADPCSNTFSGGYTRLTAEQRARCTAQGVPAGGYDQGNSQIRISVGGNPNLKPETSETQTAGLVFSPAALRGFDMTLDWWNIKLKDGISGLGGQTILNRCILEGNTQACSLYRRGPGGQIVDLLSAGLNVASEQVSGVDMTINYRLPKTSFGTFSTNWDTTYLTKVTDDTGENYVAKYFDRNNNWRIRSNLIVRWDYEDYGASMSTRYYSKQTEDCLFTGDPTFENLCSNPATGKNVMKATFYSDLSAYWKTPWKSRVTLGVNNLFKQKPPYSTTTFANSFDPQYEIPGRFFYMRYTQNF